MAKAVKCKDCGKSPCECKGKGKGKAPAKGKKGVNPFAKGGK